MGLPTSVSCAPGQRLVTASGASTFTEVEAGEGRLPAYLRLFYQGHLQYLSSDPPWASCVAYLSYILECLRTLEQDDRQEARRACRHLRDAHVVWSFVAAVYLTDSSDTRTDDATVSARLADWYRLNFGSATDEIEEWLTDQDWPEFWKAVGGLAAVGERDMARTFVRNLVEKTGFDAEAAGRAAFGPDGETKGSAVVEEMLRKCPGDLVSVRMDGAWDAWQTECREWVHKLESDCDGEKLVLGVLAGDVDALKEVCVDWRMLFVGYLTYSAGASAYGDALECVSRACAFAADVHGAPEQTAGGALTEAALGNPAGCLVYLGSSVGTAWHAAHLASLLAPLFEDCRPFANHYVTVFAKGLEWHRGLWRLAVDYLLSVEDPLTLSDFLSRVSILSTGDTNVEKLLQVCSEHGFRNVEKQTYRRLAALANSNDNLSGAIYYCAKADDVPEAIDLCLEATANAEYGGPQSDAARTLTQIPAAILASRNDKLAKSVVFLTSYAELQAAAARGSAKDVVRNGIRLIDSGGLPRKFWKGVLSLISTFVEEVQVDPQEANNLMSTLEILDIEGGSAGDIALADMRKTLVETYARRILA